MKMRILTKTEVHALVMEWPRLTGVKCSLLDDQGGIIKTVPMARLRFETVGGYLCASALDPHFGDLPSTTAVAGVVHIEDRELACYPMPAPIEVGPAVGGLTLLFNGPKRMFRLANADFQAQPASLDLLESDA